MVRSRPATETIRDKIITRSVTAFTRSTNTASAVTSPRWKAIISASTARSICDSANRSISDGVIGPAHGLGRQAFTTRIQNRNIATVTERQSASDPNTVDVGDQGIRCISWQPHFALIE
jgi:hypothetical protein